MRETILKDYSKFIAKQVNLSPREIKLFKNFLLVSTGKAYAIGLADNQKKGEAYRKGVMAGAKEYRQFILNQLDGYDIACKEEGVESITKAIRLAIKSRVI